MAEADRPHRGARRWRQRERPACAVRGAGRHPARRRHGRSRARTTKCRHAVTSPSAAAASSSMSTMRPIAIISSRGSQGALAQHGLETEIREPHLSPPNSRRRATLRALKAGQGVVIGFNAAKSHRIVDMRECHILRPELFALVAPLRGLLGELLPPEAHRGGAADAGRPGRRPAAQGRRPRKGCEAIEALTRFLRGASARAAERSTTGSGRRRMYEPEPATVTLSGDAGGAFRSAASSRRPRTAKRRWSRRCARRSAERSAGRRPVRGPRHLRAGAAAPLYAAEASRDAAAGAQAGRADASRSSIATSTAARSTRRSWRASTAVVLDPPRAGADEQVRSARGIERRADRLCQLQPGDLRPRRQGRWPTAAITLEWVRPVGQFRWSTHVELAAAFSR